MPKKKPAESWFSVAIRIILDWKFLMAIGSSYPGVTQLVMPTAPEEKQPLPGFAYCSASATPRCESG
jgi:hypothetical protein